MADNQTVLLTGINGYIAKYIADLLLKKGYHVIGTLRNAEARTETLEKLFPGTISSGQLELVDVKDIAVADAFDRTFQLHPEIDYVIHTASPVVFEAEDLKKTVIDPAITGTLSVLSAAKKYGKNVKRVVLTSSYAALTHHIQSPGRLVNEDTWNPITIEEATKDGAAAYFASKKFAEKALWDFIESEKPCFDAVVIAPPAVLGPPLDEAENLSDVHGSIQKLTALFDQEENAELPPDFVTVQIDVRDLAVFHTLPIENPSKIKGNSRYFPVGSYFTHQMMADAARKELPLKYSRRVVVGEPGKGEQLLKSKVKFENKKTNETFNIKYRTFEQTSADTLKYLMDLQDKN